MFQDKFVAFVDILGFSDMVRNSEQTGKPALDFIMKLQDILDNKKQQEFFKSYGPQLCPCSIKQSLDLDFKATQVSDCVIISVELSPVGLINLLKFCTDIVFKLLDEGILCRGYITKGSIFHTENRFIGSAYMEAYHMEEKEITFMQKENEHPPFIQLKQDVCDYVNSSNDKCVQDMFKRMTKTVDDITAIYPFQMIYNQMAIGKEARDSNNDVRKWLLSLKEKIIKTNISAKEEAKSKINHYLVALDKQLEICDKQDEMFDFMDMEFPVLKF